MNTEVPSEGLRDNPDASAQVLVSRQGTGIDGGDHQEGASHLEDTSDKKEEISKDEDNVSEAAKVLKRHFSMIPDYQNGPGLKIKVDCYLSFNFQMQEKKDSPRSTILGPIFQSHGQLYMQLLYLSQPQDHMGKFHKCIFLFFSMNLQKQRCRLAMEVHPQKIYQWFSNKLK